MTVLVRAEKNTWLWGYLKKKFCGQDKKKAVIGSNYLSMSKVNLAERFLRGILIHVLSLKIYQSLYQNISWTCKYQCFPRSFLYIQELSLQKIIQIKLKITSCKDKGKLWSLWKLHYLFMKSNVLRKCLIDICNQYNFLPFFAFPLFNSPFFLAENIPRIPFLKTSS